MAGLTLRQPARPGGYLGVLFRRSTYARILYLLASLPLAVVYVAVVTASLAFPVLLFPMVFAWWAAAATERALARRLLGVAIAGPAWPGGPLDRRALAMLRSADTWRAAAYLVLTLPFACVAFILTVGLPSVLAAFAAAPPVLLGLEHLHPAAPWLAGALIAPVPFVGTWHVDAGVSRAVLAGLALDTLAAVALFPAALHLLDALAAGWGRVAAALLSESAGGRRLRGALEAAQCERARAEQAERSRRELIVNVGHDLRTPVAAIRAHLESILMATGEPQAVDRAALHHDVGVAHRESERLGALVDDLLALARSDAGELRLDLGPVAAADVILEVCATMAPLARRERGVTLAPDAPAGLPDVEADRQRLAQVLLNLVRNAVTHTPEGGIVSVRLRPADAGHLELAVADTGAGIRPEDLDRVFERFYRTDASRARTSGGFGLGLAIVRDLVAAMDGTIGAESVPGQGSTFRVRLRIAEPADAPRR